MQVWPRIRRVALRCIIAALVFVGAFCAITWGYIEYEAHRATSLLAEAARVRIGDREASVLPLVRRYGGFKWTPKTRADIGPPENWTSLWGYEHELRTLPDYAYAIHLSPWGYPTLAAVREGRRGWRDKALMAAINVIPVKVRPLLGMRNWVAGTSISIRGDRVSEIGAEVLVEGRSGWLLHEWVLADEMPDEDLQSEAYVVIRPFMTGFEGDSEVIQTYLTPKASDEHFEAAYTFDGGCLTSIIGCDGSCGLSPRTLAYLNRHPGARRNVGQLPKCK